MSIRYNTWQLVVLIYVISFTLLLLSMWLRGVSQTMLDWTHTCVFKSPSWVPSSLLKFRGKNYFLTSQIEESDCLFTFWSLTHFILYLVLGLLTPDFFWLTLGIGIFFEILENMTLDCHDVLDVLWNSAGFLLGFLLNMALL
jgi:hypothetical protein